MYTNLPKYIDEKFDRLLTPILKSNYDANQGQCKTALSTDIMIFKSFVEDAMKYEKKRLIKGLRKL